MMNNCIWIEGNEAIRVEEEGPYGGCLHIGNREPSLNKIHMSRGQLEALRAQLNRIFNPEGMSLLDQAWRAVDALGGPGTLPDYDAALDDVMAALRKLGAMKQVPA